MSVHEVKSAWEAYWRANSEGRRALDPMSMSIFRELYLHCKGISGKRILEAGSGSGMISFEITRAGGEAYLLDIAQEALHVARRLFRKHGLEPRVIQGDIFHLPLREGFFDVIWNAGVMEHFLAEEHSCMINQISSALRPDGAFVTFNPYAGARFYVAGKRALEAEGKWPYGPEYPVTSLRKACADAGLSVLAEYPICFRDNLYYYSHVCRPVWKLLKILTQAIPERILIRAFGGYLLVTVAVKSR